MSPSKRNITKRTTPVPRLSRRAFLGGAGAVVALPLLEAMLPRRARAQASASPTRLLFYYVPCGVQMKWWTPAATGSAWATTEILAPMEPHRADTLVISGLQNLPARPDGPGDHAAGTGSFLSCFHVKKTAGDDIQNNISIDQVVAEQIGGATQFPSLQLGIDGGASVNDCDSGYSCAYARNISWAGPKSPLPKVTNPQLVFDRLFAGMDPAADKAELDKRKRYRLSVLDYVWKDAKALQGKLGKTDQAKVEEYLTSVRALETQIGGLTNDAQCTVPAAPALNPSFPEHVQVMGDLMAVAFECDLTRVISFMLGNAGSNRVYDFIGVGGAHHELSHHQNDAAKLDALRQIATWEVAQLAALTARLAGIVEADGTRLLDRTLVFWSSEIEDGDSHAHTNLPVLLVGGAATGAVTPGRHIRPDGTPPVANLFVSMAQAAGADVTSFGDATGPLAGLQG